MLMSGFSVPEIAALKVLRSGLLAIACDAVWPAIDGIDPAPVGTALRYASQPGPCGSGTFVGVAAAVAVGAAGAAGSTGVGVGSA